jgi:hypothetical protein
MRDSAIYRGYAICLSQGLNWSFTTTPITPEWPILACATGAGFHSRDIALESAKREIDDVLRWDLLK